MNGEFMIIALIIATAMLVLLIAKLTSLMKAFKEDARYICYKMDHADSYKEYRRWRGELRCHYLMRIPFVNEKNVMRIYRFFFRRGDHAKKEERKDSIVPLLMPSLLCLCICLVCVCGMTWAWYSASVQTPPQKMTAAYYEVTVESIVDGDHKINKQPNGGYELKAETTYTVKLNAAGSVKECGGYCLIENEDKSVTYCTQTFKPGESITIPLLITETDTYTFTGVWGSIKQDVPEEQIIHDIATDAENTVDASVHEPNMVPVIDNTTPGPIPAEPSTETEISDAYTVQSGDTLFGIAKKYGVTVAKLAAYNGLADPDVIRIGQIIKIPPEDWEIPAADSNLSEQPELNVSSEPMESISDTLETSQSNRENMLEEQKTTDNSTASDSISSGEPETDSTEDSSAAESGNA